MWFLSFPSFLKFLPDVFNFGIHLVICVQGIEPEPTSTCSRSLIRMPDKWLHIKKWFCFICCDVLQLDHHSWFKLQDDTSKTNCFFLFVTFSMSGTVCRDETGNTWGHTSPINSHMHCGESDPRSQRYTDYIYCLASNCRVGTYFMVKCRHYWRDVHCVQVVCPSVIGPHYLPLPYSQSWKGQRKKTGTIWDDCWLF